jgi:cysteinyl-tRNA synthetase
MSKSLKNFVTVRACLEEDEHEEQHFFPDDFRLFCCLRRFRTNVDYRCVPVTGRTSKAAIFVMGS